MEDQLTISPSSEEVIQIPKCKITKKGLEIDDSMTQEEWTSCAESLHRINDSVQFWIGDLINLGRKKFERMQCNAILEQIGYSMGTIHDYSWVAESVAPSVRKERLSFSHHKEVAKLSPNMQECWLNKAENEHLSVRDLRNEIKNSKKEFNPCFRDTGKVSGEERMEQTGEFRKFFSNFIVGIEKMTRDTTRLQTYHDKFEFKDADFKDWDLEEKRGELIDKVEELLATLKRK